MAEAAESRRGAVRVRAAAAPDRAAIDALVGRTLRDESGVKHFVATDPGGAILGTVTATRGSAPWTDGPGPGEGGLDLLAVRADTQGRGVAEALVRHCLTDARADRLDRVTTLAEPGPAVGFFERLGFRRLSWRDRLGPGDHRHVMALGADLASITVRPAASATELARAGHVTLAGYRADGVVATEDYSKQLADAAGRAARATVLIAVDRAGAVVGTVTFCRPGSPYAELSRPGEAEFRMLAVDPAARGQGVGSALVHACLDRAGEAGDRSLVLSTLREMRAAGRIYERLGFTADPARDWSPVPGVRLLAYRRDVVLTR